MWYQFCVSLPLEVRTVGLVLFLQVLTLLSVLHCLLPAGHVESLCSDSVFSVAVRRNNRELHNTEKKVLLPPVPPLSPATLDMTFCLETAAGQGQDRQPGSTWVLGPLLPPLCRGSGTKGGGIAFVIRDSLKPHVATALSFPVQHPCFETAQLTLTYNKQLTNLFCIYRPPPSKKNKFSDSIFFDQFSDISKKTTSAIPFSQPIEQDTALRPFCYVL